MRNFVVIALLAVVFLACTAEAKVKLDKIQAAAGMDLAAAVRARAHAETEMAHAEATKTGMLYFNAPSIPKDANFFHPGVKYYRGRINAHEGSSRYTYNPDAGAGGQSFLQLDNKAQTVEMGTTYTACAMVQVSWPFVALSGAILGSVDIREEAGKNELSVTLTAKLSVGVGFNIAIASIGGYLEGSFEGTVIFPTQTYKDSPSYLVLRSLQAFVLDAFNKQIENTDAQAEYKSVTQRMSNIRQQLFPLNQLGNAYDSPTAVKAWEIAFKSLQSSNKLFAKNVCTGLYANPQISGYYQGLLGLRSERQLPPDFLSSVQAVVFKAWKMEFLSGWDPKESHWILLGEKGKLDMNAFLNQTPDCGAIMSNFESQKTMLRRMNNVNLVELGWEHAARALVCHYFVHAGPSAGQRMGETPYLFGQGGSIANFDSSIKTVYSKFFPDSMEDFKANYAYCNSEEKDASQLLDVAEAEFNKLVFPEARAKLEAEIFKNLDEQVKEKIIVSDIKLTGRVGLSIGMSASGASLRNMCDDNEVYTYTPWARDLTKAAYNPNTPNAIRPWTWSDRRIMHDIIFPQKVLALNIVLPGVQVVPNNPKFKSMRLAIEFPIGTIPPFISGGGPANLASYASIEKPVVDWIGAFMRQIPCGLPDSTESLGTALFTILKNMFTATAEGANPLVRSLVLAVKPFFSSAPADASGQEQVEKQMEQFFKSVLAQAFNAGVSAAIAAAAKAAIARVFGELEIEKATKMAIEFEAHESDANSEFCPPPEASRKNWIKPKMSFAVKSFTEVKGKFSPPPALTHGVQIQGDLNLSSGTDVVLLP